MKKLLTILIILMLTLSACQKQATSEASKEAEPQATVSVKVVKVGRQDIAATSIATGTIYPLEQATVSAKVAAPIAKMELLKNRVVKAGEVLAVLESKDLSATVAEAQSTLAELRATEQQLVAGTIPQTAAQNQKALHDAQANVNNALVLYNRRMTLYQQGGIAKKELEAAEFSLHAAENELKLAEAQIQLREQAFNKTDREIANNRAEQARYRLQNAETQLSYTIIRSPISGVVTDQYQYQGEFAGAGAKLITIMALNEVIIHAQLPENIVRKLKLDDVAAISSLDANDENISGRVSLISKTVDPVSRTVEVWVRAANPNNQLRPGASAKVTITTAIAHDALAIPIKAVTFENPNEPNGTVMVVEKEIAHTKQIVTGNRQGDLIEVRSGLNEDETVIVEGNYQLPDNSKVQLEEDDAKETGEKGEKDKQDEKDGKGEKDEKGTEGKPASPASSKEPTPAKTEEPTTKSLASPTPKAKS